jgi:hypothetical protein
MPSLYGLGAHHTENTVPNNVSNCYGSHYLVISCALLGVYPAIA